MLVILYKNDQFIICRNILMLNTQVNFSYLYQLVTAFSLQIFNIIINLAIEYNKNFYFIVLHYYIFMSKVKDERWSQVLTMFDIF